MDASNRAYIQEELKKEQSEARLPRPEKATTYTGVFGPEEIDGFRAALMTDEEFKEKIVAGFRKTHEM